MSGSIVPWKGPHTIAANIPSPSSGKSFVSSRGSSLNEINVKSVSESSSVSTNWGTDLFPTGLNTPGLPHGISNEISAGSDSNCPSLTLYTIKSS